MDSPALLAVIGLVEADGIDVWLDGGWGVDALLGHQTREHDDLDLVVELGHASRIIELLEGLGYSLVAGVTATNGSIRAKGSKARGVWMRDRCAASAPRS